MTRPTKLIIDCSTGEEIIAELTDEEIVQLEADRLASEQLQSAREAAETARAAKRNSAISKLKSLGLTEDEVTALL